MNLRFFPYTLRFRFPAGTSRGVMHDKVSWYVLVEQDGVQGIGEAGPLPGLSLELLHEMEAQLATLSKRIKKEALPADEQEVLAMAARLTDLQWPSIRFALETALLDWLGGGGKILFQNSFSLGEKGIPINGLIWMGEKDTMRERMLQKLKEGYSCLKMKIGAINFREECAILAEVRKHFSAGQLMLRVDANGAFSPEEALEKLHQLATYDIHSIEQPIRAGQAEAMHRLCRETPVPIALDEELIGVDVGKDGPRLLNAIKPQYIILKPSLVGGIAASREWISLAEAQGIGWWITSALESNIGLNAISQFTANYLLAGKPQGLGTGQLYHNNIPSPLQIENGSLRYNKLQAWDLKIFNS